jgi:hypothetical protein
LSNFNEYDLELANAQLQDMVALCELSNADKAKLYSKISRELEKKNISLDCMDSH